MTQEHALDFASIAKQTYYNWLKRADAGDPNAKAFADAVRKARAGAVREHLGNIRAAGKNPQQWTASGWFLERSFPEQYGRRTEQSDAPKVVVINAKDSPVQVNVGAGYALSPLPADDSVPSSLLNPMQGEAPSR